VVDQVTSEPLSGAQVSLPALGRGQLTNATGQFLLLNVPVGEATVQVQYIGYGTETVTVQVRSGEVATVEFALGSRAINLDAMVVTGTGAPTQRRRLGQTISTVSQESLQNAVTGGSISDVLYGRVAGLTGLAKSETGASPLLLLRGTVSLSQRNQPLVYIDGVRMDNTPAQVSGTITNRLNDINPAEIERVEIIKGAAAATLFGTEASSGVIQIFTKRGVTQDPVFTAEIDQQFIHMPHSFWPVSAQYVGAESRVVTNKPAEDFVDPGYHQNYTLSVRGGTPGIKYFLSGRVMDEDGPMPNNAQSLASLRAGFDFTHSQRLRSSVDLSYADNTLDVPQPDWSSTASDFLLAQPGRISPDDIAGRSGCSCWGIEDILKYNFQSNAKNVLLSGHMAYDFREGLVGSLRVGHNEVTRRDVAFRPEGITPPGQYLTRGFRRVGNVRSRSTTVDANITWDAALTDRIQSNFTVGAQSFWEGTTDERTAVQDFASPTLQTLRGGQNVLSVDESIEEVINAGVFIQEQIGLDDRLFITAGLRMDGNSAFGEQFDLSAYPKVGLSWVLSDYDFWNLSSVDQFRIRGALGTSGLQPGAFDATRTWQPGVYDGGTPRVTPLNQGNPELKPERSTEVELALEAGLFDGRVGMELVYFNQKTTDALLPQAAAPSTGFTGTQLINIGEMKSQGLELVVNLLLLESQKYGWDLNTSMSWIDQEVTDMGPVPDFRITGRRRWNWIAEGYAPGIVISPIQDPANPYRLTVAAEDLNNLSQVQANTLKAADGTDSLVVIGNSMPSLTANLSTSFRVGQSWQFGAVFVAGADFVMSNETEIIRGASRINPFTAYKQEVLSDPSATTQQKLDAADAYGRRHPDVISAWMEDGDYLKLNEVTVSYTLPQGWADRVGLDRTTVTLGGRNLKKWTKYGGILDPGSGGQIGGNFSPFLQNIDYIATPLPRRYTFRIRTSW
jgi:outer membrane receptor protein involved in Fe transport